MKEEDPPFQTRNDESPRPLENSVAPARVVQVYNLGQPPSPNAHFKNGDDNEQEKLRANWCAFGSRRRHSLRGGERRVYGYVEVKRGQVEVSCRNAEEFHGREYGGRRQRKSGDRRNGRQRPALP